MDAEKKRPHKRRMLPRQISFTDALKEKYCSSSELETLNSGGFVVNIVYHGKPKSNGSDAELAYLRNVVLSDQRVSMAGIPGNGLTSLCPNVIDLDLSGNCLDDWTEALTILSHLPFLKFVNLSRNNLVNKQSCLETWESALTTTENLVLNETGTTWGEVSLLVGHFPALQELHVCKNGYKHLSDIRGLEKVKYLKMNDNDIDSWEEIWKLRHLPNLDTLILSGNPLRDVTYKLLNDTDHISTETLSSNNKHLGETDHISTENCWNQDNENDQNGNKCPQEIKDIVEQVINDAVSEVEHMEIGSFEDKHVDMLNLNEKMSEDFNTENSGTCSVGRVTFGLGSEDLSEESPCDNENTRFTEQTDNKHFGKLKTLCLSDTALNHWDHLHALSQFPALDSLRIQGIKLISDLGEDDRRKLKIASLPNVRLLNGSEVTLTEREKAERHFIRYFMDQDNPPERFHELEAKHGKLKPIVDIDISGGLKLVATLNFVYHGMLVFTETFKVSEPVKNLRLMLADKMGLELAKLAYYDRVMILKMYHYGCGSNHPPDEEILFQELWSQTMPLSRQDIMDGDEIHIELGDRLLEGCFKYLTVLAYVDVRVWGVHDISLNLLTIDPQNRRKDNKCLVLHSTKVSKRET